MEARGQSSPRGLGGLPQSGRLSGERSHAFPPNQKPLKPTAGPLVITWGGDFASCSLRDGAWHLAGGGKVGKVLPCPKNCMERLLLISR